MGLHIHVYLLKDMNLIQAANNIVLKQSVKNDQFVQSSNWTLRIYKHVMVLKKSVKTDQCVQSSNWILCIHKYVCVGKMKFNTWDKYYLSYPYFPAIHVP